MNNSVKITLGRHHFLCYNEVSCLICHAYRMGIYLLLLVAVALLALTQENGIVFTAEEAAVYYTTAILSY
ncbi:MAG: hypothetical protein RR313_05940 [Anaerovoracaceae bacterium]